MTQSVLDFDSELLYVPESPQQSIFFQPIYTAGDAALENRFPEVQEISKLQAGQPQIGLHLLLMGWQDSLERLEFQEHLSTNVILFHSNRILCASASQRESAFPHIRPLKITKDQNREERGRYFCNLQAPALGRFAVFLRKPALSNETVPDTLIGKCLFLAIYANFLLMIRLILPHFSYHSDELFGGTDYFRSPLMPMGHPLKAQAGFFSHRSW